MFFNASMLIYSSWVYLKNLYWDIHFGIISFIFPNPQKEFIIASMTIDKIINCLRDSIRHRSKLRSVLEAKKKRIHEMNSENQRLNSRIANLSARLEKLILEKGKWD